MVPGQINHPRSLLYPPATTQPDDSSSNNVRTTICFTTYPLIPFSSRAWICWTSLSGIVSSLSAAK